MATGKIRRKIAAATAAVAVLSGAAATSALVPNSQQFDFTVTDVVVKTDDNLARVCGNLVGMPHTSARIDSISLRGAKGIAIAADDIDGVDFERYFQWEDDGIIPLEIDFPGVNVYNKLTKSGKAEIIFHTVKGDVKIPLTLF